jgi:hypothetical protein
VVPQHGWPVPPQAAQVPPAQMNPDPQVLPPQQGWLAPPQARQLPPSHARLALPHVLPVQHGWPLPPQAAH